MYVLELMHSWLYLVRIQSKCSCVGCLWVAGWFGARSSSGFVHNVRVVELFGAWSRVVELFGAWSRVVELFVAWSRVVELFGAGFDKLPERVEEGLCELAAYTWLTDMVRCCFPPPTDCDRYVQLNMMLSTALMCSLSTAECARSPRLNILALHG